MWKSQTPCLPGRGPLDFRAILEGVCHDDANLSAAEQAAYSQARFPDPDGGSLGPGSSFPAPQEGTEASDRLDRLQARPGLTRSERYPRSARITTGEELNGVVRRGRRFRRAHLDLFWLGTEGAPPRMGLIVPKYRQSAVARNRLRRQLKEIWRRDLAGCLPSGLLVLRIRRDCYQATFTELRSDLLEWCAGVSR